MRVKRRVIICVLALNLGEGFMTHLGADGSNRGSTEDVVYSRDIEPLLDKHCVSCHSGWFPDGGLRLDSKEGLLKGGKSGPAIVPGSPEKGWLTYSITRTKSQRFRMPPEGSGLTDREIDLVKEWIRQGVK